MTTIRYYYKDGHFIDRKCHENADDVIQSMLETWRFARCFTLYPCPVASIEVTCDSE